MGKAKTRGFAAPAFAGCAFLKASKFTLRCGPKDVKPSPPAPFRTLTPASRTCSRDRPAQGSRANGPSCPAAGVGSHDCYGTSPVDRPPETAPAGAWRGSKRFFDHTQQVAQRLGQRDGGIPFLSEGQVSAPALVLDLDIVPEHVRPDRLTGLIVAQLQNPAAARQVCVARWRVSLAQLRRRGINGPAATRPFRDPMVHRPGHARLSIPRLNTSASALAALRAQEGYGSLGLVSLDVIAVTRDRLRECPYWLGTEREDVAAVTDLDD